MEILFPFGNLAVSQTFCYSHAPCLQPKYLLFLIPLSRASGLPVWPPACSFLQCGLVRLWSSTSPFIAPPKPRLCGPVTEIQPIRYRHLSYGRKGMNRHLTMILALISFVFLAGLCAFASNNTSKRTDSADTSDSALKA